MNYVSVEGLSMSYADKELFNELNFGLNQGDRTALVGRNGTGKSTFLKIIVGILPPEGGEVALRKGLRIGYLGQQPLLEEQQTILENLYVGSNPALDALRHYTSVLQQMDEGAATGLDQAFAEACSRMDATLAWEYEQRSTSILNSLGLNKLNRKVNGLSGGERRRTALAKLLIDDPEVLLLDEPTNHLDTSAIEWLESLLTSSNLKAVLFITHDRYFLDNVANKIVELDRKQLFSYKGNYSYFLEKKAEREQTEAAEAGKARQLMKKELEWLRRQPKARGTKSRSRIDAFEGIKEKANMASKSKEMELNIRTTRQGSKTIEMHSVCKSIGEKKLLDRFTYLFKKAEKIGIVGPNGVGKSTFLNLLTKHIEPDSGTVKYGETTRVGYYNQLLEPVPENLRVIEAVREFADVVGDEEGRTLTASQFLNLFLFPPKKQHDYVYNLSGGERKRLQLLKVLLFNPNFLILDEPTNDLDISTLQVLENFLMEYPGTLLIVSHDRYFLDQLVDHLFVFEGVGKVRDFPGNYSDFVEAKKLEEKEHQSKATPTPTATETNSNSSKPKTKLSYKEQRELEQLEIDIPRLEARQAELAKLMSSGETDHEKLMVWGEEAKKTEEDLEAKSDRWLELNEVGGE